MIQQPVIPRVPLALQASAGVVIDPTTGIVTLDPTALTPQAAAALLALATSALPTADPHVQGQWFNNGGFPAISQG